MGVGVAGVANYTNTSSGTASNVVAYGGVGGPYEYCSFFSVLNWFAKGEQGAWYDPSDLTTLFQDSAGTTPVTAVEQPVGLMLDKSKGLALGAELVTNGDFSNGTTGWTADTGWAISGGTVNASSAGIGSGCYQPLPGAINTWYKLTITVSNYVSGSVAATLFNGDNGSLISANGVYTCYIQKRTLSPNYAGVACFSSAFTGSVDNISVKRIAGNHAFQATSANRPILSARVNLLTKTEDFSDAVWITLGSVAKTNNYTYAPDGTLTAGRVVFASNSSTHQFFQYQATVATSYTQNIWIKVPTGTANIMFGVYDGALKTVSIPLTSQWQQFSFSTTTTVNAGSRTLWLYPDGSVGMATEIHIWHPDVRPTNAGALLPPYQRVNTASDYDSVGFPIYLKCNGTSSAMSTNSIDFTATDKMTVVTGVRKLTNIVSMFLELSAVVNSNNGSFYISAPESTSDYGVRLKGTLVAGYDLGTYAAPITNIISNNFNISGISLAACVQPRINSSIPSGVGPIGTTAGTGNFGNYPLYLFARAGTSLFLNGQFYGAIIRGAQSDTASVTQTENYMAQKTGITF